MERDFTSGQQTLRDSPIGEVLDGRYRIDSIIGKGGMGTVFRAEQLSINRPVAVKVLEQSADETRVQRFMREAKVIASLSHANIVQVIDFGEDGGRLFLVMELVDGVVLGDLIRNKRLHPNLAIEITYQMCGALVEAHSRGVVHRDLKPANCVVQVSADGGIRARVLDFGIAHVLEDETLTREGKICGTPAYMAPEQLRGRPATPAADIYALGLNLYKMLGGFRPFAGATPLQVAVAHMSQPPPPLSQLVERGEAPPRLVDLCFRMLEKDPARRIGDGRRVREELLAIRNEEAYGPFSADPAEPWDRWTHPAFADHGGQRLLPGAYVAATWATGAPPGASEAETIPPEGLGVTSDLVAADRGGDDWAAFQGHLTGESSAKGVLDPNISVNAHFQVFDTSSVDWNQLQSYDADSAGARPVVATAESGVDARDDLGTDAPLEIDHAALRKPVAEPPPPAGPALNPTEVARLAIVLTLLFIIIVGVGMVVIDRSRSAPPHEPAYEVDDVVEAAAMPAPDDDGDPAEVRRGDAPAEAVEASTRQAKRTVKEKVPPRDEVIDLFEADDDHARGNIVIEEGNR